MRSSPRLSPQWRLKIDAIKSYRIKSSVSFCLLPYGCSLCSMKDDFFYVANGAALASMVFLPCYASPFLCCGIIQAITFFLQPTLPRFLLFICKSPNLFIYLIYFNFSLLDSHCKLHAMQRHPIMSNCHIRLYLFIANGNRADPHDCCCGN